MLRLLFEIIQFIHFCPLVRTWTESDTHFGKNGTFIALQKKQFGPFVFQISGLHGLKSAINAIIQKVLKWPYL